MTSATGLSNGETSRPSSECTASVLIFNPFRMIRCKAGEMTLLRDTELADFRTSIKNHGYNEAEFKLEEGKIKEPADETNGLLRGTVTITCLLTQISRMYNTGHMSTWPDMFETDLNQGAFLS